jgi:hypothetical protein
VGEVPSQTWKARKNELASSKPAEGGFVQFHGALFQIMAGKFAARLFNELLKGDACVGKPTLKRACAQAEFLSDISQRRPLPANERLRVSFTCWPTFTLAFVL